MQRWAYVPRKSHRCDCDAPYTYTDRVTTPARNLKIARILHRRRRKYQNSPARALLVIFNNSNFVNI